MKFNLNKYFKKSSVKLNLKPLIIAEISANHGGSKKKFLRLIKEAAKNGADLIKIQTYEAEDITFKNAKVGKIKLWNIYSEAKTPFTWHKDAFKLAKKLKITLFSTPFSIRAVDFLEKFKVQLYKISSFELTDLLLIDAVAKTKKPIILSTGMATIKDIANAIKCINKYHNKIILLHCVSGYPTNERNINLGRFIFMKKRFKNYNIGLSDHTNEIYSSIASCCLGAKVIEKHFILNKKDKSYDKKFSINSEQLNKLSLYSKLIQQAFSKKNNPNNFYNKGEDKSKNFKRSIYVKENLKKGSILTSDNIVSLRPKKGIESKNIFKVLGKKINKSKKKYSSLNYNDLIK